MPRPTPANAMQGRINELEAQVTSLQQENLALRQTEERFRALFEQAADYILILAPAADGIPVIVDLNEAAAHIHGYSREELLGRPITFLDSVETRKNVPERARQLLAGESQTFEAVHARKDGSTITVEVTAQPIVVAGKQYIYAIERDISARKQTETVLRNYERIIATSREHMSLVDRSYVYRAVNDAYLLAHNHRREEIVGRSVAEMLGQETFERLVKDKLDRCLAGAEVHYQGWFQFAGIGRLFMDVAYYPLVEADGSVSGVVVNSRNLTAQHEAEEALRQAKEGLEIQVAARTVELLAVNARLEQEVMAHRQSEERLQAIFQACPDAVVLSRLADGLLVEVNEGFTGLTGYSRAEAIGQTSVALRLWHNPAERQKMMLHFTRQNFLKNFELELQRRDGAITTVLLSAQDIDIEGERHLLSVARDISDLKVQEDELRQAKKAAEAASLAKSAFLANMSHEVRTPLNAIIGFADLLKAGMAGPVTSDQQDCLAEILHGGHRLLGLITDILDLSRLEVVGKEAAREAVDLALLFGEGLDSFREKARQRNISLHVELDPSIGAIASDERILCKVVASLLENAIKFTPAGGSVGIDAAQEKGELRVTVWDTGIGISEEQMTRLFLPFQQGDSSITKEYQGLGLGLVLCKRFVELLGGRIQVESTVQAGSRFTFFVPE